MVQDRIRELIKALGLTANGFSAKFDIQQSIVHNIVSGRGNAPRWETYEKILEAVPEVSAEWLSRGTPPMFLDAEKQQAYEAARQQAVLTTGGDTNTQIGIGISRNQKLRQLNGSAPTIDPVELAQVRTALAKCQDEKDELGRELRKSKDKIIDLLERK